MKLLRLALILILSLFLGSCVTQRRCSIKYPPIVQKDSIYVETVVKIPVPVPGDTIKVDVPVNCPDQDIVSVENSKLKQQIKILNGRLVSNTEIKPDTVYVHTKETKTITKEVKVPQPVRFIPDLYKVSLWLWAGVLVAVGGYIALRLFVFKK
jgi:hypothetical protein